MSRSLRIPFLTAFLLLLPAAAARGDDGELRVLDLRTQPSSSFHGVAFLARAGSVDHAFVVLGSENEAGLPVLNGFGLHAVDSPMGVRVAAVGPVPLEVVRLHLAGDLAPRTTRIVCQVDAAVWQRADRVREAWVARAEAGLTSRDATPCLVELARAAGLVVPPGAEDLPPHDLVVALLEHNPALDPGAAVALPLDLDLARVGTVGEAPAAPEAIVVDVHADGRLFVGGEGPLGLPDLLAVLRARTAPPATRLPDFGSRLALLVRADRAVPWALVQWVLMTGASPDVQLFRIFFAARPWDGDAWGAIGVELPRDRSLPVDWRPAPQVVTAKLFVGEGRGSDPAALYPILRRLRAAATGDRAPRFEIKNPPPHGGAVPTGIVVQVLDAALRAGFRDVTFEGAPMLPPGSDDAAGLQRAAAALRAQPGAATIRVGDVVVPDGLPETPDDDDQGAEGLVPRRHGAGRYLGPLGVPQEGADAGSEAPGDEPLIEDEEIPEAGPGGEEEDPPSAALPGHPDDRPGPRADPPPLDAALRWLAAHQSPDGRWEAAGFGRWCDGTEREAGTDGGGEALHDVGVTGLALCAFLGAGYTNRGRHPFAVHVARGLRYLKTVQDAEGAFGPRTSPLWVYDHAFATLAMVQAYGRTQSPIFKGSAQRALAFVSLARNPYFAWRYGVKPGDNDTSVTTWMALALLLARRIDAEQVERGRPAPLAIDEEAFDGVRAWIEKMTDPETGRVGYIQRGGSSARPMSLVDRFPPDRSEAMTAAAVVLRTMLGDDPQQEDVLAKGVRLLEAQPPVWDEAGGRIDMVYWVLGTLASWRVGAAAGWSTGAQARWRAWDEAFATAVLGGQRRDGDPCTVQGSWDPVGPWGPFGGRVYATALMAMGLEIHYRYEHALGTW